MARVLSSSRILDDRGREVPTVRIRGTAIWDGRDSASDLPDELEEACAAAVEEFHASRHESLFSVWGALTAVLCLGFIFWLSPPKSLMELIAGVVIVLGIRLADEWFRRSRPRSRCPFDERLLATLLAASRCPSCGYDLSKSESDPEGLTACAECGAAWKLPPSSHLPTRRPGVPERNMSGMPSSVSYTDGRGRAVWLANQLATWPHARDAMPAAVREPIAARLNGRLATERLQALLAGLLIAGFAAFMCLMAFGGGSALFAIFGAIASAGALTVWWSAWRQRAPENPQAVAQVFLDAWVCPSCTHHIEEPIEEPDGCITCPTCNAAWRVRGSTAHSPGTVPDR